MKRWIAVLLKYLSPPHRQASVICLKSNPHATTTLLSKPPGSTNLGSDTQVSHLAIVKLLKQNVISPSDWA